MSANTTHLVRFTGFAIGAAIAIAVVMAGRMPESQAEAPARLTIASQPTTELGLKPAGTEFLAGLLRPGEAPARGVLTLDNYTPRPLSVAMRVTSHQRDLDSVVRVRASLGGRQMFSGPLGALRSWTGRPLRVPAKGLHKLEFRAWVPMSTDSGYEGRSVELQLEWKKAKS
jgi:hypothetical protein